MPPEERHHPALDGRSPPALSDGVLERDHGARLVGPSWLARSSPLPETSGSTSVMRLPDNASAATWSSESRGWLCVDDLQLGVEAEARDRGSRERARELARGARSLPLGAPPLDALPDLAAHGRKDAEQLLVAAVRGAAPQPITPATRGAARIGTAHAARSPVRRPRGMLADVDDAHAGAEHRRAAPKASPTRSDSAARVGPWRSTSASASRSTCAADRASTQRSAPALAADRGASPARARLRLREPERGDVPAEVVDQRGEHARSSLRERGRPAQRARRREVRGQPSLGLPALGRMDLRQAARRCAGVGLSLGIEIVVCT